MAGGWGAAWDFGTSDTLAAGITKVYTDPKVLIGSVCHGSLGFIKAKKPNGDNVCKGTKMTGVTDRQIEELGIAKLTP
jgi:putative intracellular protease/amidase